MRYLIAIILVLSVFSAPAQETKEEKLLNLYQNELGANALLYNGVQFYGYDPSIQGSAFYADDSWNNASLIYNGIHYHNVSLRFDLVGQQLIVNYPGLIQPVILITENVHSFTLEGKHFKKLTHTGKPNVPEGFYEVLQNKSVSLFARRLKVIRRNPTPQRLEQWFEKDDTYLIGFNKEFFEIDNKRSLYKAFPNEKSLIKKFLKDHDFNLRKDPETALKSLALYLNNVMESNDK